MRLFSILLITTITHVWSAMAMAAPGQAVDGRVLIGLALDEHARGETRPLDSSVLGKEE